jgi:hypothetical protein
LQNGPKNGFDTLEFVCFACLCHLLLSFGLVEENDGMNSIHTIGFHFNPSLIVAGIVASIVAWMVVQGLTADWDTWTYYLVCLLDSFLFVTGTLLYSHFTSAGSSFFIEIYFGVGLFWIGIFSLGLFLVSLPVQWVWSRMLGQSRKEHPSG